MPATKRGGAASAASSSSKGKGGKAIEMSELMKHNTAEDCWIAVRGEVYDITDWVYKHPGGVDPLALNGGRDATQLFECYHDPRHAKMLDKYHVGSLVRSEYPSFPPQSAFHLELKAEVQKYFDEKKMSIKHAPMIFASAAGLVTATFALWYASCQIAAAGGPAILAYACAALSGIAGAFICFQPVHEGSHCATTSNPYVWRALGSLLDFCNGGSYYIWLHQHFLGHHPFTNVTFGHDHEMSKEKGLNAADPDVLTNDPDIRRISNHQGYRDYYRFQKFYVPVVYALLSIKFRINDIVILYSSKQNGVVRVNPPPRYHEIVFWAGKIFWFCYRILGTYYLTGSLMQTFLLYCVYDAFMSYTLALVFQVNHVVPQCVWPTVNAKDNTVDVDWAKMQIATTLDYAHGDALTTWMVGALNYQTIHHLFPNISQVHYIHIGHIVRDVCKKHGVKFNYVPTYKDALSSHISHLANMGKIDFKALTEL